MTTISYLHGNMAGSTDPVQMPTKTFQNGYLKAMPDNTGNVYIGSSSDVAVAGTTDTNTTGGLPLSAGDVYILGKPGNLQDLWYICDNATDDLVYFLESF